jgi:hypothetical protein
VVIPQPSKLKRGVRFPYSAFYYLFSINRDQVKLTTFADVALRLALLCLLMLPKQRQARQTHKEAIKKLGKS